MLGVQEHAMLKLDHVVFPVRDAERTMAFYRETLGLPLIAAHTGDDWGGHAWLMMVFGLGGGQEIVTVALQGAPAPDYRVVPIDARHYALTCGDGAEFEAWRTKLRAANLECWEEDHGDQQSIYFPDPDGVILEVTWPASGAETVERRDALEAVRRWIANAKAFA
jgi:catechol 2,3-dioxygenase-like lactoylglutathione lyase family enzyme